jgi:hypothetical protein
MKKFKQNCYIKEGYRVIPLVTIIILLISFVFVGGQHFAAQKRGVESTMNRPGEILNKDIPPIDLAVPEITETATFALG